MRPHWTPAEDLRERLARMGGLGRTWASWKGGGTPADERVQAGGWLVQGPLQGAGTLAKEVEQVLHDLGMPHAVFRFEHTTGEPGPRGIDRLRMLFSANRTGLPNPGQGGLRRRAGARDAGPDRPAAGSLTCPRSSSMKWTPV